jgi:tRNA (cytidine/uridine-2'-O-)-methyltransferase
VRRAGLDYWPEVTLQRHSTLADLRQALPQSRFVYLSTKADKNYTDWIFTSADCLVLGGKREVCRKTFSEKTGIGVLKYPC